MIEAYAFLAAFTLQVLVMSVLLPIWFIKYLRTQATRFNAERARLYPGVDLGQAQARFLTQYRTLVTVIGVSGLLLLGWLFDYMRRPDWDDGTVVLLATGHFLATQMLPLCLFVWVGARFNKQHKRALPEGKRTAILKRRGLFDFVSPFVVLLAVVSYLLFAAFVIYLRERPFPGFAGLINLGAITLAYALNGFIVYMMLYGRNKNSFETHAGRLHTIRLTVKSSVYSCIVIVMYLSLNFSLRLLELKTWEPFALSMFFIICALVGSMGFAAPLRKPDVETPAPTTSG